jgi:hypothetical protein
VGGDLEDAVGGGVDDQIAAVEVLFAEFADDFGAGGGFVAEDAPAGPGDEGVDDFGGKTGGVERERAVEEDAGEFPVAGGGVLAGGGEGAAAEETEGGGVGREVIEGADIGEAEALEIGERERPSGGEMAEGIAGFGVEEIGPVGHGADAGAVENEEEDAGEHVQFSERADWIRAVSMSTKRSGMKPFIRLKTRPDLVRMTVVGIDETRRCAPSPSSK